MIAGVSRIPEPGAGGRSRLLSSANVEFKSFQTSSLPARRSHRCRDVVFIHICALIFEVKFHLFVFAAKIYLSPLLRFFFPPTKFEFSLASFRTSQHMPIDFCSLGSCFVLHSHVLKSFMLAARKLFVPCFLSPDKCRVPSTPFRLVFESTLTQAPSYPRSSVSLMSLVKVRHSAVALPPIHHRWRRRGPKTSHKLQ